jgi:hypothetical protein
MLKIDGHDDAVIGSATPWSNHTRVEVLVYDGNKIVEKLVSEGMTQEEAFEFVEFNLKVLTWERKHRSLCGREI